MTPEDLAQLARDIDALPGAPTVATSAIKGAAVVGRVAKTKPAPDVVFKPSVPEDVQVAVPEEPRAPAAFKMPEASPVVEQPVRVAPTPLEAKTAPWWVNPDTGETQAAPPEKVGAVASPEHIPGARFADLERAQKRLKEAELFGDPHGNGTEFENQKYVTEARDELEHIQRVREHGSDVYRPAGILDAAKAFITTPPAGAEEAYMRAREPGVPLTEAEQAKVAGFKRAAVRTSLAEQNVEALRQQTEGQALDAGIAAAVPADKKDSAVQAAKDIRLRILNTDAKNLVANQKFLKDYRDFAFKNIYDGQDLPVGPERKAVEMKADHAARVALASLRAEGDVYWPFPVGDMDTDTEHSALDYAKAFLLPETEVTPSGKSIRTQGTAIHVMGMLGAPMSVAAEAARGLLGGEPDLFYALHHKTGFTDRVLLDANDLPRLKQLIESEDTADQAAAWTIMSIGLVLDVLGPDLAQGAHGVTVLLKNAKTADRAARAGQEVFKATHDIAQAMASSRAVYSEDVLRIAEDLDKQGKTALATELRNRANGMIGQSEHGRAVQKAIGNTVTPEVAQSHLPDLREKTTTFAEQERNLREDRATLLEQKQRLLAEFDAHPTAGEGDRLKVTEDVDRKLNRNRAELNKAVEQKNLHQQAVDAIHDGTYGDVYKKGGEYAQQTLLEQSTLEKGAIPARPRTDLYPEPKAPDVPAPPRPAEVVQMFGEQFPAAKALKIVDAASLKEALVAARVKGKNGPAVEQLAKEMLDHLAKENPTLGAIVTHARSKSDTDIEALHRAMRATPASFDKAAERARKAVETAQARLDEIHNRVDVKKGPHQAAYKKAVADLEAAQRDLAKASPVDEVSVAFPEAAPATDLAGDKTPPVKGTPRVGDRTDSYTPEEVENTLHGPFAGRLEYADPDTTFPGAYTLQTGLEPLTPVQEQQRATRFDLTRRYFQASGEPFSLPLATQRPAMKHAARQETHLLWLTVKRDFGATSENAIGKYLVGPDTKDFAEANKLPWLAKNRTPREMFSYTVSVDGGKPRPYGRTIQNEINASILRGETRNVKVVALEWTEVGQEVLDGLEAAVVEGRPRANTTNNFFRSLLPFSDPFAKEGDEGLVRLGDLVAVDEPVAAKRLGGYRPPGSQHDVVVPVFVGRVTGFEDGRAIVQPYEFQPNSRLLDYTNAKKFVEQSIGAESLVHMERGRVPRGPGAFSRPMTRAEWQALRAQEDAMNGEARVLQYPEPVRARMQKLNPPEAPTPESFFFAPDEIADEVAREAAKVELEGGLARGVPTPREEVVATPRPTNAFEETPPVPVGPLPVSGAPKEAGARNVSAQLARERIATARLARENALAGSASAVSPELQKRADDAERALQEALKARRAIEDVRRAAPDIAGVLGVALGKAQAQRRGVAEGLTATEAAAKEARAFARSRPRRRVPASPRVTPARAEYEKSLHAVTTRLGNTTDAQALLQMHESLANHMHATFPEQFPTPDAYYARAVLENGTQEEAVRAAGDLSPEKLAHFAGAKTDPGLVWMLADREALMDAASAITKRRHARTDKGMVLQDALTEAGVSADFVPYNQRHIQASDVYHKTSPEGIARQAAEDALYRTDAYKRFRRAEERNWNSPGYAYEQRAAEEALHDTPESRALSAAEDAYRNSPAFRALGEGHQARASVRDATHAWGWDNPGRDVLEQLAEKGVLPPPPTGPKPDNLWHASLGQLKGLADFTQPDRALLSFFKYADAETLVHEPAHLLRRLLPEPVQNVIEQALGVRGGVWTRAQEEAFAHQYTTFLLHQRVTGNRALDRAYATISDSLRAVIKDGGVPLDPSIKKALTELHRPAGASTVQTLGGYGNRTHLERSMAIREKAKAFTDQTLKASINATLEAMRSVLRPAREVMEESLAPAVRNLLHMETGAIDSLARTIGRMIDSDRKAYEALTEDMTIWEDLQDVLHARANQAGIDRLQLAYLDTRRLVEGLDADDYTLLREAIYGDHATPREASDALWKAAQDVADRHPNAGPGFLRDRNTGDALYAQAGGVLAIHNRFLREGVGIGMTISAEDARQASRYLSTTDPDADRGMQIVLNSIDDPTNYRGPIKGLGDFFTGGKGVRKAVQNPFASAGQAAVEIAGRMNSDVYIPQAVLDRMLLQLDEVAATQNLSPGNQIFLRSWKTSMTMGTLTVRPWYHWVNHFSDTEQIMSHIGVEEALLLNATNLFHNGVLGTVGAAPAMRLVDAIRGLKPGETMRRFDVAMSFGAIGQDTTRILNGTDEWIVLGGRRYNTRNLYKIAAARGVLETQGFGELVEMLSNEAVNRGWFGKKLIGAKRQVQDVANMIALRQRVGLFRILLNKGHDPDEAAKLVTEALYDYRHSLHPIERGMVFQLFNPFWTFKKNNTMRMMRDITVPGALRRVRIAYEAKKRGAQVLTYVWDTREDSGFDTEAMQQDDAGKPEDEQVYPKYQAAMAKLAAEGVDAREVFRRIRAGEDVSDLDFISVQYWTDDPLQAMLPSYAYNDVAAFKHISRTQQARDYFMQGVGIDEKEFDHYRAFVLPSDANLDGLQPAISAASIVADMVLNGMMDPGQIARTKDKLKDDILGDPTRHPWSVAILRGFFDIPLGTYDRRLPEGLGVMLHKLGAQWAYTKPVTVQGETPTASAIRKDVYLMPATTEAWLNVLGGPLEAPSILQLDATVERAARVLTGTPDSKAAPQSAAFDTLELVTGQKSAPRSLRGQQGWQESDADKRINAATAAYPRGASDILDLTPEQTGAALKYKPREQMTPDDVRQLAKLSGRFKAETLDKATDDQLLRITLPLLEKNGFWQGSTQINKTEPLPTRRSRPGFGTLLPLLVPSATAQDLTTASTPKESSRYPTQRFSVQGSAVASDPQLSSALIRDGDGPAKGYHIGDQLPDGSNIEDIRQVSMGETAVQVILPDGREVWLGRKPTKAPPVLDTDRRLDDYLAYEQMAAEATRQAYKDNTGDAVEASNAATVAGNAVVAEANEYFQQEYGVSWSEMQDIRQLTWMRDDAPETTARLLALPASKRADAMVEVAAKYKAEDDAEETKRLEQREAAIEAAGL